MEAGKLRHQVKLQRVTVAADSHGDQTKTWTDLATVRASIEPLSGRELVNAQAMQSDVTHRVRMRYVAGVQTKHRIAFGSRVFDIRAVRDIDERNLELEMLCTDGASAG